ncbi:UNVERIFIED_CONTAM: hypothetical protein Scaly_2806200 [Sesamum calycinum]|uniref:Uncharacterized protein n=1 Tax=Sesamum calycinum TaxID=2727403 RepID=A0AAW2IUL1_9LAMI
MKSIVPPSACALCFLFQSTSKSSSSSPQIRVELISTHQPAQDLHRRFSLLNFISSESSGFIMGVFKFLRLKSPQKASVLLSDSPVHTAAAFTSLVIAAVPTLFAMRRAAISLSRLADTAREELPSTMAAIRLSGMEISDLTLELSDLSQEIADGVNKSAQAVQAAEAGIRQIGSLARQQTMSMIQERASLPIISLQPVVAGAAKKTSRAVGQATKTFLNIISRGERDLAGEDGNSTDRIES